MLRPNRRKTLIKEEPFIKKLWEEAGENKTIEFSKQEVIFHLTKEEAEKCRFELKDNDSRILECIIHRENFAHGVRAFPPHLWDLKDGLVYFRKDKNSKWVRWIANIQANKQRVKNTT